VSAVLSVNILINEREHGGSVSSDKVLDQCQDRVRLAKATDTVNLNIVLLE